MVTKDHVTGNLRKMVQEVKLFQREVFPLRYFKYHRDSGLLQIAEQAGKPFKTHFCGYDVFYARKSRAILAKKPPSDFSFAFEVQCKERLFALFAESDKERDIWIHEISNNSRVNGQNMSTVEVQKQLRSINQEIKGS